MSRAAELWRWMARQWPILGVDPLSAERLRRRAAELGLAASILALVDWTVSLLLFVAPFLAHLALGRGPISALQLLLLLALGTLLFVALQRPVRFLVLLGMGGGRNRSA